MLFKISNLLQIKLLHKLESLQRIVGQQEQKSIVLVTLALKHNLWSNQISSLACYYAHCLN